MFMSSDDGNYIGSMWIFVFLNLGVMCGIELVHVWWLLVYVSDHVVLGAEWAATTTTDEHFAGKCLGDDFGTKFGPQFGILYHGSTQNDANTKSKRPRAVLTLFWFRFCAQAKVKDAELGSKFGPNIFAQTFHPKYSSVVVVAAHSAPMYVNSWPSLKEGDFPKAPYILHPSRDRAPVGTLHYDRYMSQSGEASDTCEVVGTVATTHRLLWLVLAFELIMYLERFPKGAEFVVPLDICNNWSKSRASNSARIVSTS